LHRPLAYGLETFVFSQSVIGENLDKFFIQNLVFIAIREILSTAVTAQSIGGELGGDGLIYLIF
jgi:hypothetical protein